MGILDDVLQAKSSDDKERAKLGYEKFLSILTGHLKNSAVNHVTFPGREPEKGFIEYDSGEKIVVCDEPLIFINEFNSIETPAEAEIAFRTKINGFQTIKIEGRPENDFWLSSSEKELKLRPGLKDQIMNDPNYIPLGDDCVHGLVVGRTGSGKSVFLNTLLFNLMAEYAPWEINLFLVDFKKVELSKYLSGIQTPHVNVVAATSEIRYVISMLEYLLNCMNARQTLFKKLQVDKLSNFRKKYGVVMPRTLLLVDEFQQMFLESTPAESQRINDILMSITKLGRNVGFHLLFASQEMSGALSGKAMANFKAKFALPCDSDVSSAILGNSEASEIHEKGIVIVNTKSGKREDNIKFKVPLIEQSYFNTFLEKIDKMAQKYGFKKQHKYYEEDFIEKISALESKIELLATNKKGITNSSKYFDVAILGPGVVFNFKKWDWESVYFERGKKKAVCVISPDINDIIYMQKLLAVNLKYIPEDVCVKHHYISLNPLVYEMSDIFDCTDLPSCTVDCTGDSLEKIIIKLNNRKKMLKTAKESLNIADFLIRVTLDESKMRNADYVSARKQFENEIFFFWNDIMDEMVLDKLYFIDEDNESERKMQKLESYVKFYYSVKVENKNVNELFPMNFVWINGPELFDNMRVNQKYLSELLIDGTLYNFFPILLVNNDDDVISLLKLCEYIFISGSNDKIYNRYNVRFTKKSETPTIDFKIKSMNIERSFKQFAINIKELNIPELDFDALLGGE